jgi:hypothetical protein
MAICPSNCVITLPQPVSACNKSIRPGGINRLLFLKCTVTLTGVNLLDPAVWCAWIANSDLTWTGTIKGEKTEATFTNKQFTSCGSESPTGKMSAIQFEDFGADDANFEDYDFWNTLYEFPDRFYAGWVTCDGLFYGWIPKWSIRVDDIIEPLSTDSTLWRGTLNYTTFKSIKPINGSFIENLLNGGCP